jgi:chromatin segregation and condensation protein Rec8/ScpA/Scc1 (kleisin family)
MFLEKIFLKSKFLVPGQDTILTAEVDDDEDVDDYDDDDYPEYVDPEEPKAFGKSLNLAPQTESHADAPETESHVDAPETKVEVKHLSSLCLFSPV